MQCKRAHQHSLITSLQLLISFPAPTFKIPRSQGARAECANFMSCDRHAQYDSRWRGVKCGCTGLVQGNLGVKGKFVYVSEFVIVAL